MNCEGKVVLRSKVSGLGSRSRSKGGSPFSPLAMAAGTGTAGVGRESSKLVPKKKVVGESCCFGGFVSGMPKRQVLVAAATATAGTGIGGNNNASLAKTKVVKTSTRKISNSIKSKQVRVTSQHPANPKVNDDMNVSLCPPISERNCSDNSHSYEKNFDKNSQQQQPPPPQLAAAAAGVTETAKNEEESSSSKAFGEGDNPLNSFSFEKTKVQNNTQNLIPLLENQQPQNRRHQIQIKNGGSRHQHHHRGGTHHPRTNQKQPPMESSCLNLIGSGGSSTIKEKIEMKVRAQTAQATCHYFTSSSHPDPDLVTVENEPKIEMEVEDKVIEELFNAASARQTKDKDKKQFGDLSLASAVSSATWSTSTFCPADPEEVKCGETMEKVGQSHTPCRGVHKPLMPFERIQYRIRMEEILEKPIKDLVAFSKGVLLMTHHNILEGTLRVTNLSSEPICIRVSSSISPRYKLVPKMGMIDPDQSLPIRISTKQLYTPAQIRRDKFSIESAIIPDDNDLPRTHKQQIQFWKTILKSKIQKAQTNLTFIFQSDDPKFRRILAGDVLTPSDCEDHSKNNNDKKSQLQCQLSESLPLTAVHDDDDDDDGDDMTQKMSEHSNTKSSKSGAAAEFNHHQYIKGQKEANKKDLPATTTRRKKLAKDPQNDLASSKLTNSIIANNNNNNSNRNRQLFFSFLQVCPFAAGLMLLVYHMVMKH